MADTYSRKPFISKDGPDETGYRAEVKIVMGFGEVFDIEESDAGKSAKVSFKCGNTKYKPAGWAPVDSDLIKLAQSAKETGEAIHFRIETRRKEKVDRTIPINDLSATADAAKENVYKSLSAVRRDDDKNWIISQYARTNMAEDPGSIVGGSANDYTIEELRAMSGGSANNAPDAPRQSGIEAPPYALYNNDGSINVGSIAVGVPSNIHSFLVQYMKDNGIELDSARKFAVVKTILKACNDVQLGIYEGEGKLEKPDLSLGSHTRARALIFESIRETVPLTQEILNDDDLMKSWLDETVDKAVKMWQWSIKLVKSVSK